MRGLVDLNAPRNNDGLRVGLDVGTTAVKAAALTGRGEVIARARGALPPVAFDGSRATQPIAEVLATARRVLVELLASLEEAGAGPVAFVAITTQRDTVVTLDAEGHPSSELVSWLDRRWLDAGSLWDALVMDGEAQPAAVRSLTSFLTEAWTGRAVESRATVPRDLSGAAHDRLVAFAGAAVDLPAVLPIGAPAGALNLPHAGKAALHVTAGDKNCELLGGGVRSPVTAGLSLGTGISLGTLAGGAVDGVLECEEPGNEGGREEEPGVVQTRAALYGRWNLEVGLLGAWDAPGLRAALRSHGGPDAQLQRDVFCVPYYGGALDTPGARPVFAGLPAEADGSLLLQAWAQGIVGELRRMRPALERASGAALESVVLSGGHSDSSGWPQLVADGLALPVRAAGDAWLGAIGAVAAVEEASGTGGAAVSPWSPSLEAGGVTQPSSDTASTRRYYEAWDRLAAASRAEAARR
ncbi:MAG: FGGY family carbohydrate kinase [Gemmatimonadota bacterium]